MAIGIGTGGTVKESAFDKKAKLRAQAAGGLASAAKAAEELGPAMQKRADDTRANTRAAAARGAAGVLGRAGAAPTGGGAAETVGQADVSGTRAAEASYSDQVAAAKQAAIAGGKTVAETAAQTWSMGTAEEDAKKELAEMQGAIEAAKAASTGTFGLDEEAAAERIRQLAMTAKTPEAKKFAEQEAQKVAESSWFTLPS